MSGKGNCYDNSAVESFFKSLKAELVWLRDWHTRRVVEVALFEYIKGFYNPRRKHSAIGWKSPVTFEQRTAEHEHLTGTEPVQAHSVGQQQTIPDALGFAGHPAHLEPLEHRAPHIHHPFTLEQTLWHLDVAGAISAFLRAVDT